MNPFRDNPFSEQLAMVASVSGRVIETRAREAREDAQLTAALRGALTAGADINDLSSASGLAPDEIRRRVEARPTVNEVMVGAMG